MDLNFEDEALCELYEYGSTTSKKYRKILNKDVIKKYKKTIDYLCLANKRSDWFKFAGLNYEVLNGAKVESVRIDKTWRLLFKSTEDDKLIIQKISLIEISNHYGDN
ncbi:plasmid maintenance system killer protein [Odoribacter sp. OF09-27XD]|jgi:plasmid maintenance system killer protein|nr:type II toxin-antitoxin system RelE/ParE family toxin [Odoribacter sp. OF09-27XD]RHV92558.1 plasmid maintenance system killer protein [Odoribacter sp. OF09-27XD]DAV89704.1 MAG TPA: endoribonuclease [Bacteriophage sp.]